MWIGFCYSLSVPGCISLGNHGQRYKRVGDGGLSRVLRFATHEHRNMTGAD